MNSMKFQLVVERKIITVDNPQKDNDVPGM